MKKMIALLLILSALSPSLFADCGVCGKDSSSKKKHYIKEDYKEHHRRFNKMSSKELHDLIKKNIHKSKEALHHIHIANEVLEKRVKDYK